MSEWCVGPPVDWLPVQGAPLLHAGTAPASPVTVSRNEVALMRRMERRKAGRSLMDAMTPALSGSEIMTERHREVIFGG